MNDIAEKRNFCLMLSFPGGQQIAQSVGMTPPSQEVQELEEQLIDDQWELLHDFGIYDEIEESVEWFTEVLSKTMDDEEVPPPAMLEGSKGVLVAFGMALVQKMLENQVIALITPVE